MSDDGANRPISRQARLASQVPPLLISLHMPKTAGTSFGASLEAHFGSALYKDYADFPLHVPPKLRHRQALQSSLKAKVSEFENIRCIHGHFLPVKYLLLADYRCSLFVTWLREPVARMVSHYYYWLDAYESGLSDIQPLHRQVVEEKWSLSKFCLSTELRNVYCQFLWGFPLERFDFIGITENYESDLCLFAENFLHFDMPSHFLNRRKSAASLDERAELPGSLRSRIERWHASDLELYRRARDLRMASDLV